MIDIKNKVKHENGEEVKDHLYSWDEETRTFRSTLNNLVLLFEDLDNCKFITGSDCKFMTGSDCTFKTRDLCTFMTGFNCTFATGSGCTFTTRGFCTFMTLSNCKFMTGSDCTFATESDCTFTTRDFCTFKTKFNCTFKTMGYCVILRKDIYEVIEIKDNEIITIFPYQKKGYLVNNMYQGEPHIICDGIVSRIISQRENIYKVVNLGEEKQSWVVKHGEAYAHGDTLKEAQESIIYKISERNTEMFKDYTLETVLSKSDCINIYRAITGACETGVRDFVKKLNEIKDSYRIRDLIALTENHYGAVKFSSFFKK